MDSEDLDRHSADVLRRLESRRGSCPPPESLLAFHGDELAAADRKALESHLELCGLCREAVDRLRAPATSIDEFTWKRAERALDRRPAPWRTNRRSWTRFATAAAALVLVAAPAVWFWNERRDQATSSPVTRGSVIELREPAGQVSQVSEFRWGGLPAHASFRIQVQRGEELLWEAPAREPRYRPTAEQRRLLETVAPLRWRVQGLDERGQVLDESGWITFQLVR